jgi:hypothetical protein
VSLALTGRVNKPFCVHLVETHDGERHAAVATDLACRVTGVATLDGPTVRGALVAAKALTEGGAQGRPLIIGLPGTGGRAGGAVREAAPHALREAYLPFLEGRLRQGGSDLAKRLMEGGSVPVSLPRKAGVRAFVFRNGGQGEAEYRRLVQAAEDLCSLASGEARRADGSLRPALGLVAAARHAERLTGFRRMARFVRKAAGSDGKAVCAPDPAELALERSLLGLSVFETAAARPALSDAQAGVLLARHLDLRRDCRGFRGGARGLLVELSLREAEAAAGLTPSPKKLGKAAEEVVG